MTHRETGEVMVMKELIRFDDETQRSFLKEVGDITLSTLTSFAFVDVSPSGFNGVKSGDTLRF